MANTKKLISIIFAVIILFFILFVFSSCNSSGESISSQPSSETSSSIKPIEPFELEHIGTCDVTDFSQVDYYRDTTTDVLYVCFIGHRQAGLTEMHDPETGLPLTYTRYMEIYNNFEEKE